MWGSVGRPWVVIVIQLTVVRPYFWSLVKTLRGGPHPFVFWFWCGFRFFFSHPSFPSNQKTEFTRVMRVPSPNIKREKRVEVINGVPLMCLGFSWVDGDLRVLCTVGSAIVREIKDPRNETNRACTPEGWQWETGGQWELRSHWHFWLVITGNSAGYKEVISFCIVLKHSGSLYYKQQCYSRRI